MVFNGIAVRQNSLPFCVQVGQMDGPDMSCFVPIGGVSLFFSSTDTVVSVARCCCTPVYIHWLLVETSSRRDSSLDWIITGSLLVAGDSILQIGNGLFGIRLLSVRYVGRSWWDMGIFPCQPMDC